MSDEMKPVEVYRLKLARGNQSGSGSGGDWRLYESRKEFEADLLCALIEAAAHGTNRDRSWPARWWLQHKLRKGEDVPHAEWTTSRVVAAERLVSGEWVDLGASLIEPSIRYEETR